MSVSKDMLTQRCQAENRQGFQLATVFAERTERFFPHAYEHWTTVCPKTWYSYQQALQGGSSALTWKDDNWKLECDYFLSPDSTGYEMARPAFFIGDPIRASGNWKSIPCVDIQNLVAGYKYIHHLWSSNNHSIAIIYEELTRNSHRIFECLCLHWGIPFSGNVFSYDHTFGDFLFANDREKGNHAESHPTSLPRPFSSSSAKFAPQESQSPEKPTRPFYCKSHPPP